MGPPWGVEKNCPRLEGLENGVYALHLSSDVHQATSSLCP